MNQELRLKHCEELSAGSKARFEKKMVRHPGLGWTKVQARLQANPDELQSRGEMEGTRGGLDVLIVKSGDFIFMDCVQEGPVSHQELEAVASIRWTEKTFPSPGAR